MPGRAFWTTAMVVALAACGRGEPTSPSAPGIRVLQAPGEDTMNGS